EALHICKFASEVILVHRRDAFRAEKIYQRQVANNDRIDVHWNTVLKEVRGDKTVNEVLLAKTDSDATEPLAVDGVFIFVGTKPNTKLICSLVPKNCGGHIDTDLDMMTEVQGLFAIGDVREHSYRQVATAVGEGATAAMAAGHYLEHKSASE
ncbi:MAG: NAD(P)/FAD-dependent oxidoreductase, partial [Planctomycetota bacterium]